MVKGSKKDERKIQIGLDIGSFSVKAAAIYQSANKPELVGFSIKPVADQDIRAIHEAHAQLGLNKKKVAIAISGPAVLARYLEMPSMTEAEFKSAARFEAEKIIPYRLDQVVIDCAKVEGLAENRMRIVIVAAKKDVVDTRLRLLNEAGLEPSILDVDSFAVMNAFVASGIDKESVCGLLNIGAKTTNLNIIKKGVSYLSRDIDVGGADITKALSEQLAITDKEAERIKVEPPSQEAQPQPDRQAKIDTCYLEVLSRLSDEVRLSFDFYETNYVGNVEKVYLSGGSSQSKEVVRILRDNLGCETVLWNPMAAVEIGQGIDADLINKVQSQMSVAIGLGLRSID